MSKCHLLASEIIYKHIVQRVVHSGSNFTDIVSKDKIG